MHQIHNDTNMLMLAQLSDSFTQDCLVFDIARWVIRQLYAADNVMLMGFVYFDADMILAVLDISQLK